MSYKTDDLIDDDSDEDNVFSLDSEWKIYTSEKTMTRSVSKH